MDILIKEEITKEYRLNWTDKVLLSVIRKLEYDNNKNGCSVNYYYLADIMQMSMRNIKNIIAKLKSFDLIKEVSFDGRIKTFKTNLESLKSI